MNNSPITESPFIHWASKVGTFLGLSVVWIFSCLLVVTIIPACVALYDSVVYCVHGEEPGPYRRYFATLKAELLRGIGLSMLWIAVVALLIMGFIIVNNLGNENSAFAVYSVIYAGTMLLPLAMLVWLIPLQARFHFGFAELHRTAMTFVIVHLPATVGLIGILLLAVMIIFVLPALLLLIPAIAVTLQAALAEKVFKKFEEEEAPIVK